MLASPTYLGLRIIQIIILPYTYTSALFPYTPGTRIARLLGVNNLLNNYSAMYTRLSCSRIFVELASPADFLMLKKRSRTKLILGAGLLVSPITIKIVNPHFLTFQRMYARESRH